MKLNTTYSQNNPKLYNNNIHFKEQEKYTTAVYDNLEKKNDYKYNIKRPAQAISFGGSAVSMSDKFIQNKFLNKVIGFVNENEAAYNAIFSLFVAGMLKPFVVLNMPGSEDKDKQIVATKNFLQAFLGSFFGITITGGIVKKSVDIINNNLELIDIDEATNKIKEVTLDNKNLGEVAEKLVVKEHTGLLARFKNAKDSFVSGKGIKKVGALFVNFLKAPSYTPTIDEIKAKKISVANSFNSMHKQIFQNNINFTRTLVSNSNKKDAYNSFWKNITGSPVAIGKAKISSILLPIVVGLLFAKRTTDKAKEKQANANSQDKKDVLNNESQKKDNKIAFKGALHTKTINLIAKNVEKLSMSKTGESVVNALGSLPGPLNKPSARMGDIESLLVTAYWIYNTSKSEKIEPSQKLGLNVHTATVTIVSSTCAFLIDTMLDGLISKTANKYGNIIQEIAQSVPDNLKKPENKEELVEFLKEKTDALLNSKKIVKSLSDVDLLNKDSTNQVINALSSKYKKQLSKFKSLSIFTLVVRFLVPVLMVPVSGKIKRKIVEIRKEKELKEQKA